MKAATGRTVQHGTFTIERDFAFPPARVFAAKKISVSLATVEFEAAGKGTKLIVTEQGAFLDGYDDAGSREREAHAG